MGTAEAANPGCIPWRAAPQDEHAFGDERHTLFAANRMSLAVFASGWFPAVIDVLQHFP
jgi:hypothetical protein